MAALKTRPTDASVPAFLDAIADPRRQRETRTVTEMMTRVTGEAPCMWGESIIGFGRYRYRNTRGNDFEWFLTGVAPRKAALTVYVMPGFKPFGALLDKLGKHRTGSSCLYISRLDTVDAGVLEDLVRQSVDLMRKRYP